MSKKQYKIPRVMGIVSLARSAAASHQTRPVRGKLRFHDTPPPLPALTFLPFVFAHAFFFVCVFVFFVLCLGVAFSILILQIQGKFDSINSQLNCAKEIYSDGDQDLEATAAEAAAEAEVSGGVCCMVCCCRWYCWCCCC